MKILWNKRAVTQLHQIEDYILSNFGERIRREYLVENVMVPDEIK